MISLVHWKLLSSVACSLVPLYCWLHHRILSYIYMYRELSSHVMNICLHISNCQFFQSVCIRLFCNFNQFDFLAFGLVPCFKDINCDLNFYFITFLYYIDFVNHENLCFTLCFFQYYFCFCSNPFDFYC